MIDFGGQQDEDEPLDEYILRFHGPTVEPLDHIYDERGECIKVQITIRGPETSLAARPRNRWAGLRVSQN